MKRAWQKQKGLQDRCCQNGADRERSRAKTEFIWKEAVQNGID